MDWAEKNNLRLNCAKTKEIVFRPKGKRGTVVAQRRSRPAPCDSNERVSTLTMLGVVLNEQLTAADHVSRLLTSCSRLLYALRVLRNHGVTAESMADVISSTVIAKLM